MLLTAGGLAQDGTLPARSVSEDSQGGLGQTGPAVSAKKRQAKAMAQSLGM